MRGAASASVPVGAAWHAGGPVVLGAAVTGVLGLAAAVWLARMATYAERLEEQQYCRPAELRATA
jgi:hypothetical protein